MADAAGKSSTAKVPVQRFEQATVKMKSPDLAAALLALPLIFAEAGEDGCPG
jgi:hypothetical protein